MKANILCIEDNEQNLYLVRIIMEANGHVFYAADNGKKGIEMAISLHPDLILLDIQLPAMDGYAVARELRKHPEIANVPIIAVTSYAMIGDREKSLAAGCTDYIEKPINPDTFLQQVERHLPLQGKDAPAMPSQS
ncbi:MAG: response regulator [Opitutaceae bacterium]|jgi:CheY-like chemotaxis protein